MRETSHRKSRKQKLVLGSDIRSSCIEFIFVKAQISKDLYFNHGKITHLSNYRMLLSKGRRGGDKKMNVPEQLNIHSCNVHGKI